MAEAIEHFSPPIFAAYCSKNGMVCIERLQQYKGLIGPMQFFTIEEGNAVKIEMISDGNEKEESLPQFLAGIEMIFLINLIRKATKEHIRPLIDRMQKPIMDDIYHDFCGCEVISGECIDRIASWW